ncbi:MAG TPA: hypothetical protein VER32_16100, partial [Pyrinomonadaceae bacterium]|nr:hypothetical protein [Pyrinomonadaceae bacterium]
VEVASDARASIAGWRGVEAQAYAADALWPHDEQTARAIFRRAWESAEASDRAELEEERAAARRTKRAPAGFTNAREIVLPLAARRDARLAGQFLQEMEKSMKDAGAWNIDGSPARADEYTAPDSDYAEDGLSLASTQRLRIAKGLMDEGDAARAGELAAPVVESAGVSYGLVTFLLELRTNSVAEADRLFLRLLEKARANPATDANDILALSSYVIAPSLQVGISDDGSVGMRYIGYIEAVDVRDPAVVGPRVRAAFYETAAAVLLRQGVPAVEGPGAAAKVSALYFTTGRLLPYFDREAPQLAPQMHARHDALAQLLEEAQRRSLSSRMNENDVGTSNRTDPLRSSFEELGRAATDAERDAKRLEIVNLASNHTMWDRARRAAEEITDPALRARAHRILTINQIANLRESYPKEAEDDYERAAGFVRRSDVPPLAHAFGLAEAAGLAAKRKKRQRAAELLQEAFAAAERVERSTLQRVAAFAAVAVHAPEADPARAWETVAAFVAAANALEDYAGDESKFPEIDATEDDAARGDLYEMNSMLFDHTLEDVFEEAGRLDVARAVTEARALQSREARAFAVIAAARAVLDPSATSRPMRERRSE